MGDVLPNRYIVYYMYCISESIYLSIFIYIKIAKISTMEWTMITFQDFTIQGMKVSSGQALVYMTHHAQRDPTVFEDPDEFIPSRWENK